ncbi:MAG: hypothetical protein WCT85_07450, partial [Parachlamydiales bacterium]
LILQNPSGTIRNMFKKNTIFCFSSDKLFWQNFENALLLKGNVKIIDSEFGTIDSEEIEIIKKFKENNLKKIIARKNSSLNFFAKNKGKLTSKGVLEIDHEKKIISAFNIKNQNEDLIYEDPNVFITSKKAKSSYDSDNNIQDIILENDVHFIYKKDNNSIGYGIADKIEYFPNEHRIKLLSYENKKVLFWQADNSIRLSAKEIIINQKEKNDIKGIGDVRFAFNLEEENLIHEIFSKYLNYE